MVNGGQSLGQTSSGQYLYSQPLFGATQSTQVNGQQAYVAPKQTGSIGGGQVLGASTSNIPKASNIDNYAAQTNQTNQNQTNMELDAINAEYNQEINRLNDLQGNVTNQYNTVKGQAEQYFPEFQKQTEAQKAGDLASLQNTEDQRKQESSSAMGKARALLAELQRRQMAYMSATGNYSSSTADAFGEQFGRQANSQLGDIQTQRDTALRQVETERQKVNTFYSGKILEAKQSYDKQLSDLNSQFMGQLDQINNAKGVAASAKRQARVDTWRNFTNAKLQLDNQLFQYKTQYDQWKSGMDQKLQATASVGSVNNVNADYSGTNNLIAGVGTQQQSQSPLTAARTNKATSYEDLLKQQTGSYQT